MRKAIAAFVFLAGVSGAFEDQQPVDIEIRGHVLRPGQGSPDNTAFSRLKVPPGFRLSRFAENLGNVRMMAVADDGTVYVTRRQNGDCLMLRDVDGDGRADEQKTAAKKEELHGIALDGNDVYLTTVTEVFRTERRSDGTFRELTKIADLPDGGQHPNRTLAVGPDGMLYVSVGSTCNACSETNPEHATMLRMKKDGSEREIFARGLRNTIGFGWHPESKELLGMDHNTDWLGDEVHEEELNQIEQGKHYGWPYVYSNGTVNPRVAAPPDVDPEQLAKTSVKPLLGYTAHAAPMQMAFYTGEQFPPEYRGDAFIAMRGSWNRRPPVGYEVVRLRMENGKPSGFEPFLTGFVYKARDGSWMHSGRLAGLAVMKDGSLLAADDTNGVIYRVSHMDPGMRSRTR